jgi:hypothetical protein
MTISGFFCAATHIACARKRRSGYRVRGPVGSIQLTVSRLSITAAYVLLLIAASAGAQPRCTDPAPKIDVLTCAGDRATLSAPFPVELTSDETLTVLEVVAPLPFVVTGVRLDDEPAALPLTLLPGQRLVADVEVILSTPGIASGLLVWTVAENDPSCTLELSASTPTCDDAEPDDPCVGSTCADGECVRTPTEGACDDGDACTEGDACRAGVCEPGPVKDCAGDPCLEDATCVDGTCVGTAVECDDGVGCTEDRCDPGVGCVHVPSSGSCPAGPCVAGICDPVDGCISLPLTGQSCDDGDGCTVDDRCAEGRCAGQPRVCADDGFPCTAERCLAGACTSVPVDARCESGECEVGSCRPADEGADARGCVEVAVGEGEACTDDALSCTDDVCTAGVCLHVPIDSRCSSADQCSSAVCTPEASDHDATGCTLGPPLPDVGGAGPLMCAEDGDPCSADQCRDGQCVHPPVPERETCLPVQGAFRKTLGLAALTRGLMAEIDAGVVPGARSGRGVGATLMERLHRVEIALDAGALALAGRAETAGPQAITGGIPATPAQRRAQIAFTFVLNAPAQVRSFLQVVAEPRTRAQLGRDASRSFRRRGRLLLRGTKNLKGELRRLQQVSKTFAR